MAVWGSLILTNNTTNPLFCRSYSGVVIGAGSGSVIGDGGVMIGAGMVRSMIKLPNNSIIVCGDGLRHINITGCGFQYYRLKWDS